MKPGSTEERRTAQKRGAVRGVLLFAFLQVCSGVAFWALGLIPGLPGWCKVLCWVLALIIPAVLILKARFQEIEGVELDAAGKY